MNTITSIAISALLTISANTLLADTPSAACPPNITAGGTLSYLNVIDANGPMPCMDIGWWYFVGLMQDQQGQAHSIQINLFRKSLGSYGSAGAGSIGFTYNDAGHKYYLWSSYPNDLLKTIGSFAPTVTTKNNLDINVSTQSMSYHFYHNPNDTTHQIGQAGAQYILSARGQARIGVTQMQPLNGHVVSFNTLLHLTDQRGLLPEGKNGFIGTKDVKSSWEFGAPDLRVTDWAMTIDDPTHSTPLHFNSTTEQANRIWYDRQVLYKKNMSTAHADLANGSTLYRGTWMSFCFNQKPLKGYCGVAVAFWNKGIATKDMDSASNAYGGFLNLYTPISDGNSGNVITDINEPNSSHKFSGYRIQNDRTATFHSQLSPNVYDRSVYLTIDPTSSAGAIINAKRHNNSPLRVKLTTSSPLTENVMYDIKNAFYEGAATVSLCTDDSDQVCATPLGTGFVEQMGYSSE